MTKNKFYEGCPKTRAEFVGKWNTDATFRNWGKVFGFSVIGGNVLFPTGKVAGVNIK